MKPLLSFLLLFSSVASAPAVTIDMVTIGNPGNAPDTRYPDSGLNGTEFGAVPYVYQIGKYEITADQYTEFLNAVAKADPSGLNGLYDERMADGVSELSCNIQRSGASPNFSYSVAADWANRPVNYVTFWDAVRFANWLHNGQPTGPQGPTTTESGAYHDVGNSTLFGRNADARFFIPTENEWYKAAYHNESAGQVASYFDYPTATNTEPINTLPDSGNHANFYDYYGTGNHSHTIGTPYFRTEVGAFANSPSPYGTFDQGGNVWEWNETKVNSVSYGLRGGGFDSTTIFANYLYADVRSGKVPLTANFSVGFRIAAAVVPEPSTIALVGLAAIALISTCRRTVAARILHPHSANRRR